MARKPRTRKDVDKADVGREIEARRELYSAPSTVPAPAPQPERQVEQLRKPPASMEAEQAVLGAMLIDNTTFWTVRSKLAEEDFYLYAHRAIYRAIETMAEKDEAFDWATLTSWFESRGEMGGENIGGYLIELHSSTPTSKNAEVYAGIVAECAHRRRLIGAGTELVSSAFEPQAADADEIASTAVAAIESASRDTKTAGKSMRAILSNVMEKVHHRFQHNAEIIGIETPWPRLTEMLGGLQPGRLYVIGGRAKMGKSIMLGNIATYAALSGHAVGRWDLEMGEEEVGLRALSETSEVEYKRIERARLLEDNHWGMMTEAVRKLRDAKITVYDEPGVMAEKIVAQATMLHARGECSLAVIDYLQIVKSVPKERRDLEIGHISGALKNMAKRLEIPVVVGSQINRGNESGHQVRPPRPSDARESGNIEQDVDAMVLIHRPGYYDKKSRGTRVEVALNRSGETGVFRLEEDLARSRFLHSNLEWIDGGGGGGDVDSFAR